MKFSLLFVLFYFSDRVSPHRPGWPRTYCVDQADLVLLHRYLPAFPPKYMVCSMRWTKVEASPNHIVLRHRHSHGRSRPLGQLFNCDSANHCGTLGTHLAAFGGICWIFSNRRVGAHLWDLAWAFYLIVSKAASTFNAKLSCSQIGIWTWGSWSIQTPRQYYRTRWKDWHILGQIIVSGRTGSIELGSRPSM